MIDPLDWFELNDEECNKEFFDEYLIKNKTELFKINEDATMYYFNDEYFCLDTKLQKVTYYMGYSIGNNPKIGKYVWQSLVWTDPIVHKKYLTGVANKMFFDYLFLEFHTILTDSKQTWDGRRFWQYALADAFEKNLNIYFIDFATNHLVKLESYKDLNSFQLKYKIWGKSPRNQIKRMIITDKDLK